MLIWVDSTAATILLAGLRWSVGRCPVRRRHPLANMFGPHLISASNQHTADWDEQWFPQVGCQPRRLPRRYGETSIRFSVQCCIDSEGHSCLMFDVCVWVTVRQQPCDRQCIVSEVSDTQIDDDDVIDWTGLDWTGLLILAEKYCSQGAVTAWTM
ncbi:hypothetical protein IF1G_10253 [Cordyceps javanica]|uniref:Uncharacterized protein n=1 Tax=Cordyceps javanica TaxID=43265 RepID=A0A545UNH5_9HYPO|nr:hypothetical protein IF1G_10253 [Cordyceps javanica]TQW02763.1 hypothetical protein IF2G_09645 [Cordyceps javanica]